MLKNMWALFKLINNANGKTCKNVRSVWRIRDARRASAPIECVLTDIQQYSFLKPAVDSGRTRVKASFGRYFEGVSPIQRLLAITKSKVLKLIPSEVICAQS